MPFSYTIKTQVVHGSRLQLTHEKVYTPFLFFFPVHLFRLLHTVLSTLLSLTCLSPSSQSGFFCFILPSFLLFVFAPPKPVVRHVLAASASAIALSRTFCRPQLQLWFQLCSTLTSHKKHFTTLTRRSNMMPAASSGATFIAQLSSNFRYSANILSCQFS